MATNTAKPSKRQHERVGVALPVRAADKAGTTRDISVGGIYFELDDKTELGSDISFVIELEAPQGRMNVTCRGQVVRAEKLGSRTGIAVQLADMNIAMGI